MSPSQPSAMSPSSRANQIPGTLVLNWQPPETQASKPLVRRPMTACEACRSAKVKCNRQQTCERCRNRGLRCTYANSGGNADGTRNAGAESATAMATTSPSNSQTLSSDWPPAGQTTTPDPMSADWAGGVVAPSTNPSAKSATEHGWEGTFHQALEQFDWIFPESDLGFDVSRPPRICPCMLTVSFPSHPRIPDQGASTCPRTRPSAWAGLRTTASAQHPSPWRILLDCPRKCRRRHGTASAAST